MSKSNVFKRKARKSKTRKLKRKFGKSTKRVSRKKDNSNIKILGGLIGSGLLASGLYYAYNNNLNPNKLPKIGLLNLRNIDVNDNNVYVIKTINNITEKIDYKPDKTIEVKDFTTDDLFIIKLQIDGNYNSHIFNDDYINTLKDSVRKSNADNILENIISYIEKDVNYLKIKNLKFIILVDLLLSFEKDKRNFLYGDDESKTHNATLDRNPAEKDTDTHIEKYYKSNIIDKLKTQLDVKPDIVYFMQHSGYPKIIEDKSYNLENIYKILENLIKVN